ncbi:MAG: TIGR02281 family clan AA aspartic protease [Geminicoccaceae bacterium]|nr:TIGR02281 family clan AA aspartic protease [Geminicoccaceae bacterium]
MPALLVAAAIGGLVLVLLQISPDALDDEGGRMSLVYYSAWIVLAGSAILFTFRGRWGEAARHAVAWTLILLALVAAYSVRHDVERFGLGILASLVPGMPVALAPGEVALRQAEDGHFYVRARIDDASLRLLVDTGASTVALTAADAERVGLDPQRLRYDSRIRTANGVGFAAPVRLERVQIGDIEVEDVRGAVLQEGMLGTSLLGMSFLGRLRSYQFEGDSLILRN